MRNTKKNNPLAWVLVAGLAIPALGLTSLASAQGPVVEPHNRLRGEASIGTGAPSQVELMRVIESGSTNSIIAALEYGERVECHACVAPLSRNLLENGDAEVRRISAWWLRRRVFAIGAVMSSMRTVLESDADPTRRARAAMAIGEFLDPNGLTVLRDAAMTDTAPVVRESAVRALGRLNHPEGNAVLGAALADEDVTVRRAVLDVVLTVNFFRENDALIGALADSDDRVRMRAARLAGEMRIDAAVPVLTALLQSDANVLVRQAAAWGLGRINGEDARGALRGAQETETESQVLDAVEVALRMTRR